MIQNISLAANAVYKMLARPIGVNHRTCYHRPFGRLGAARQFNLNLCPIHCHHHIIEVVLVPQGCAARRNEKPQQSQQIVLEHEMMMWLVAC